MRITVYSEAMALSDSRLRRTERGRCPWLLVLRRLDGDSRICARNDSERGGQRRAANEYGLVTVQ